MVTSRTYRYQPLLPLLYFFYNCPKVIFMVRYRLAPTGGEATIQSFLALIGHPMIY